MSQFMHWDTAKLVAQAHHRDLRHLAKPLQPVEKPVQREPELSPQRPRRSIVLAVIVALSKR